tara:strand:- start:1723 stop:2868 length:1146 start_codon:yes stop_codon:yes gene_type:complete
MAVKTKTKGKGFDERGTGPEPVWDTERALTMDDKTFSHHMNNSLRYYAYHYSTKDLKKNVVSWMQDNGYEKVDIDAFIKSPAGHLGITACSLATAHKRGMPLKEDAIKFIKERIEYVSKIVDIDADEDVVEQKVTAPAQVKTIQDRLQEKTDANLAHFDGLVDELVRGNKVDPKAFEYFKANNVPQAQLSKYTEWAEQYVSELKEAQAGQDEDLAESYKHYKAADFKRMYAFFDKFDQAIDQYRQVKKQTKKARVKRAPNKEKAVSKMKYLKEDNNLKLASINPVDIIGAQELWVYNVKTRKMFKYVADDVLGPLNVKGTTVLGFNPAKSIGKTVRKPEQVLSSFMKAGKVQLRKFLDDIKAVSIPANGRINKDILLLKAL